MSRFWNLVKMNIRLLLRNKYFVFFLCITPMVSLLILNLKMDGAANFTEENARARILELKDSGKKAVYVGDYTAFRVKVYDGAKCQLSEYVLQELTRSGAFTICRLDVRGSTEEEIQDRAKKDAFDDRAGVLLYIKPDFERSLLVGDYENAMQLFIVSDDERIELFETELGGLVSQIRLLAQSTGADGAQICEWLDSVKENMPEKKVVSIGGAGDAKLTVEQGVKKDLIGYALAIITLGFLFCGVCVAHTVIEEQNNKVYTRIMLSGIGRQTYLSAKLFMTVVIAACQTAILGVGMFLWKDMSFGISKMGLSH